MQNSKQDHTGSKPDAISLLGPMQRLWRAEEDISIKNLATAERFGSKVELKQSFFSGITKNRIDTKISHTPKSYDAQVASGPRRRSSGSGLVREQSKAIDVMLSW